MLSWLVRRRARIERIEAETDADFSLRVDELASIERPPLAKSDPIGEVVRILAESPTRPLFRLQLLGRAADRGPSIMNQVALRASDASEGVREAARLDWPPPALGFRLIAGEGRDDPLSQGKNSFVVIGARSGVGVTSFAANLALSFAQMSVPTLLVDANLRRPGLAALFGVDRKTEGLVEALTLGGAGSRIVALDVVPGLSLLAAGAPAPNPQELLISKEFLMLSQYAQRNFGAVIYDTPPALASADAYIVASRVGSAILVARRHRTKVKEIEKIAHVLTDQQCEIAGSVLVSR